MIGNEDGWQVYEILRKENREIMKDASNNYNKAILVLSAAAIGLMSQPFRGNSISSCHCIFVTSIWFFFISIVASLISFLLTEIYANKQIKYDRKYYLEGNQDFKNEIPLTGYIATGFQIFSGCAFVIAILLFAIVLSVSL